jgi:hypothetical protein
MKSVPKTGTTGETTFVVEEKHCIEFAVVRTGSFSQRVQNKAS